MKLALVQASFAGLMLIVASCGYSSNLRAPEGHSSVGLELFGNATDLRDLEADLYQAISLSMTQLVGTPLVEPGSADIVVRGKILDYRRRGGIRSVFNSLQETGVRVTVEAYLWNRSTGTQVGETANSTIETGYIVGQGSLDTSTTNETRRNPIQELAAERDARTRALRLAAEELVFELFAAAPPNALETSP